MRLFVVIASVAVLTTAPALACPQRLMCLVTPDSSASPEVARPRRHVSIPHASRVELRVEQPFDFGEPPPQLAPGEIEMPWIWQVLREQVYARMPRYEQPQRFALVLSPVVVTSPADTIPGVGVAGGF